MFERLFSYPAVIQRHRTGPFATEREDFIEMLFAKGMAQGTLLRIARYCRCLSEGINSWPAGHRFKSSEIETLIAQWATINVVNGRASGPKWPMANARFVVMKFLQFIDRLYIPDAQPPGKYEAMLVDLLATRQNRWCSPATLRGEKWQINRFLRYIEQREIRLDSVTAMDVDA